eukprot:m51a1_g96 putative U3 small nucleolar ribonucleoprotein protein (640) ;mRNA; f:298831-301069
MPKQRRADQQPDAEKPEGGPHSAGIKALCLSDPEIAGLCTLADTLSDPSAFLEKSDEHAKSLRTAAKTLYDNAKKSESCKTQALPQLLLEGFDDEQVWQQIELLNKPVIRNLEKRVESLSKALKSVEEPADAKLSDDESGEEDEDEDAEGEGDESDPDGLEVDEEDDDEEGGREQDDADMEGIDDADLGSDAEAEGEMEDGDEEEGEEAGSDAKEGEDEAEEGDKTMVKSDKFFSLEDMERFVDEADKLEADEGIEDPDEAEEEGDDDEEEEPGAIDMDGPGKRRKAEESARYEDFFDPPAEKEDDAEAKTKHEQHLKEMRKRVDKLEDELVADKHWTLKGEVSRRDRPENSLLEAVVEFDTAAKPAPVITKETTTALNEIIMKRIADASWDDVERKVEVESVRPTKRMVEHLDATRDQRAGLAEQYEEEYKKKIAAAAPSTTAEPEKLTPEQKEVSDEFKRICRKLDALAHFHFTPKPIEPRVEVLKNTPAISMEEAVPVVASTASLLAPEEVYEQKTEAPESKEELSREEKARAHRLAKRKARRAKCEREEKQKEKDRLRPETEGAVRRSTQKSLEELKGSAGVKVIGKGDKGGKKDNFRSSSFFQRLQSEAKSEIKRGASRDKDSAPARSAGSVKL